MLAHISIVTVHVTHISWTSDVMPCSSLVHHPTTTLPCLHCIVQAQMQSFDEIC